MLVQLLLSVPLLAYVAHASSPPAAPKTRCLWVSKVTKRINELFCFSHSAKTPTATSDWAYNLIRHTSEQWIGAPLDYAQLLSSVSESNAVVLAAWTFGSLYVMLDGTDCLTLRPAHQCSRRLRHAIRCFSVIVCCEWHQLSCWRRVAARSLPRLCVLSWMRFKVRSLTKTDPSLCVSLTTSWGSTLFAARRMR